MESWRCLSRTRWCRRWWRGRRLASWPSSTTVHAPPPCEVSAAPASRSRGFHAPPTLTLTSFGRVTTNWLSVGCEMRTEMQKSSHPSEAQVTCLCAGWSLASPLSKPVTINPNHSRLFRKKEKKVSVSPLYVFLKYACEIHNKQTKKKKLYSNPVKDDACKQNVFLKMFKIQVKVLCTEQSSIKVLCPQKSTQVPSHLFTDICYLFKPGDRDDPNERAFITTLVLHRSFPLLWICRGGGES